MRFVLKYKNGIILWIILISSIILLLLLNSNHIYEQEEKLFRRINPKLTNVTSSIHSMILSQSKLQNLKKNNHTANTISSYFTPLLSKPNKTEIQPNNFTQKKNEGKKRIKLTKKNMNANIETKTHGIFHLSDLFDLKTHFTESRNHSLTQKSISQNKPSETHAIESMDSLEDILNQQEEELKRLLNHFQSRYLILGIAHNTDIKNLAIFMGSLRSVVKEVEVILFVNKDSIDKTSESLERHGKKSIPTTESLAQSHRIHLLYYVISELHPISLRQYHPSSLRWIFFYHLLSLPSFASAFDHIILVDVRDTAFQYNPFDMIPKDKRIKNTNSSNKHYFYAFAEDTVPNIGSCGWNSGWIKDCFSQNTLQRVLSNPISCSGISMGSALAVTHYLYIMSSILLGQYKLLDSKFPTCERNGVDQGIHNVIVGLNLLKQTPIISSIPGMESRRNIDIQYELKREANYPVTNLQHSYLLPLSSDHIDSKTGYLLDNNKNLFSIVHQYDRDLGLQLTYAKKFIRWVDFSDPLIEFTHDESCKGFQYKKDVDLFKGICDIGSYRAISFASCCGACIGHAKSCKAFSFVDGICWFKGGHNCDYNKRIKNIINSIDRQGIERYRLPKATTAYMLAI